MDTVDVSNHVEVFATNEFKEHKNSEIDFDTRNKIGCKAISGHLLSDIAKEYDTDTTFVHRQKKRVQAMFDANRPVSKVQKSYIITKTLIERIVIGCMVFCKGSTEDCQRFLALIFCIHISIGKISGIINKAAENARIWNESVSLEKISIGANDEIFQGSTPILVGVDPRTVYIYLFQIATNREANTWGCLLLDKSDKQGLWLSQAVSDAGKGIIRGTKDAFGENINYQADIFHTLYEFNKGIRSMEHYAYRCISDHAELLKKRAIDSTIMEQIKQARNKEIDIIRDFDKLCILYSWIRELLGIGGYFYQDRVTLFKFIIEQLESLNLSNNYIKKSIKFMKNNLVGILQFVRLAEDMLPKIAAIEGIDENVIRKMWLQDGYNKDSSQYNYLEAEIGDALGDRYWEIRQVYINFKEEIVRASSIVECINSLIRPYINLKRSLPEKFTNLLQMYFNTRNFRRSNINTRCDKSPYELLTGKRCDNLLDILCPMVA